MKMRAAAVLCAVAVTGAAAPVLAIPALARRYGVACDYCHQGYPKLNPIGQRFKERGLRMDQEDPFVAADWLRSVPLSVRASGTRLLVDDFDDSSFGLAEAAHRRQPGPAAFVLGGLRARHQRRRRHCRTAAVDNAWAQVEIVHGGKLYAKVGRFELDLPFTQVRSPHLFRYEIYDENPGFEYDAIGLSQDGLELGGGLPGDVRWSAAVVAGRDPEGADDLSDETGSSPGTCSCAPPSASTSTGSAGSRTSRGTRWP